MISISTSTIPTSPEALREALISPSGPLRAGDVNVQGQTLDALTALDLDLSIMNLGMQALSDLKPVAKSDLAPELVRAERLHLGARVVVEGLPADASIDAHRAVLGFQQSGTGLKFVFSEGETVLLSATAKIRDIEAAIARTANQQAGGAAEIKGAKLILREINPQQLAVRVEIQAKAFITSGTIVVEGELVIDETKVARVRGLKASGSGMLASMAGAFLKPHFARAEAQSVSITSALPPPWKGRNVSWKITDSTVAIHAEVGI